MSGERKGKKRPKSYYIKSAAGKKLKRSNDLAPGMKGFIITCNKYERETVREMYNILNEYADQMYGPEIMPDQLADNDNNSDEEEDMEKAMARETSAIKEAEKTERRFKNTDTKSKNCIFIRTTVEDPSKLAHNIFTDVVEKQIQKTRYALRILPIDITCKANRENIKVAAEKILKPHFETPFGVGLKYSTVCKVRNNQQCSKSSIIPELSRIVHELNPLHKLSYDEPDLVILVEVIRNIACLSVVKDYYRFKKYNFHQVLKTDNVSDVPCSRSVEVAVDIGKGSVETSTEAAREDDIKSDETATELANEDANKSDETATEEVYKDTKKPDKSVMFDVKEDIQIPDETATDTSQENTKKSDN